MRHAVGDTLIYDGHEYVIVEIKARWEMFVAQEKNRLFQTLIPWEL